MALEAIPFKASSHIKDIGYDPDTQELIVDFGRASYAYANVPPQVAEGFSNAPSAGVYLDTQIKGVYQYRKL